jgi:hypothetical protein
MIVIGTNEQVMSKQVSGVSSEMVKPPGKSRRRRRREYFN